MNKHKSIHHTNSVFKGLFYLVFITVLSACGKDDAEVVPVPNEVTKKILKSGLWKVQSVTVNGADQTSMFTGFSLSFAEASFQTSDGGPVWNATGTWAFGDDSGTKIKLNGTLMVRLVKITDDSLILEFTWDKTTIGTSRNASISGLHVFVLTH